MRWWLLLLAWVGWALPALAAKPVTVEQLQQILSASKGKADDALAGQIAGLELTERLPSIAEVQLEVELPGEKSRQALVALANISVFLTPPAADIPSTTPPTLAEQRKMMGLAVDYVSKTIHQLPNFLATKSTVYLQNSLHDPNQKGVLTVGLDPIRGVNNSTVTMLYRDGKEVSEPAKGGKSGLPQQGLSSWGEFGPVLSTVLIDAASNKLGWSHWEQGATGPMAVFAYSVPQSKAHYAVNYCCIQDSFGMRTHSFQALSGYHGQMAIDPATGSILRILIEADLKPDDPITRAAILIEYSAVKIGGKAYICPQRSVALAIAQSAQAMQDLPLNTRPGGAGGSTFTPSIHSVLHTYSLAPGPMQTLLNVARFSDYHVFRAEMRVQTDKKSVPAENLPPTVVANGNAGAVAGSSSASPALNPPPQQTAEAGPLHSTVASGGPATAPALPPPAAPPAAEAPEFSLLPFTHWPDSPGAAQPPNLQTGFSLRTTTRLVDVDVVAYDKMGRTITGLKPADFEIDDSGRKQDVRFFSQAEAGTAAEATAQPAKSAGESDLPTFSNHPSAAAANPLAVSPAEQNSTILLIDSSNLAWGDLSYARREILRFLKKLPDGNQVGLYVLKSHDFQVLAEPTADRAQLAATLNNWMPNARDLAQAQSEERRNRQQFDWVHGIYDLTYVNGNGDRPPETLSSGSGNLGQALGAPVDPQLLAMGSSPGTDALFLLQGVARHLAPIPGHKNLVWITSDNVLADYVTQAAAKQDQGDLLVESLAVNTQEPLNDAHVSIYPLDASQLEAGGIAADIGTRNALAVGKTDRDLATASLGDAAPDSKPGRITAQMQQDTRSVQSVFRELAQATGGRALRRAGDIASELNGIVDDGRAAYLLSFAPDTPPDDQYHHLTVKVTGRSDIRLRYRTGYLYSKEPAALKDLFRQAVWQPGEASGIGLSATPVADSKGILLNIKIAAADLELVQNEGRWNGTLDVFLVDRDDAELKARATGERFALRLTPATYQKVSREGIPLDQHIDATPGSDALRVVAIDENSGRIGTITIPAKALAPVQRR